MVGLVPAHGFTRQEQLNSVQEAAVPGADTAVRRAVAEGAAVQVSFRPPRRRHELRSADLRQRGIEEPPLDLTRLHSIAFLIRAEDTPYDAWFDDLRFLAVEP